jgi:hypothetical protein
MTLVTYYTDIKLPVKVEEDSFFAVNIDNQANFIEEIINLGKLFCQDKVTIFEKGGDVNYVYGTSNANFPGLDKKEWDYNNNCVSCFDYLRS